MPTAARQPLDTPPVDAVILAVSFNSAASAARLIDSLRAQQGSTRWHIVVVCTGARDEAAELSGLVGRDDRVTVVQALENLGYLGGARYAWDGHREMVMAADWVVVTNADITFEPTALSALRDPDLTDERIAIVGPTIAAADGSGDENPYMRHRPTRVVTVRRMVQFGVIPVARVLHYLARGDGASAHTQPGDAEDIYAAYGACFALSRTYCASADLSHPVFLFGEELTLGETARAHGWRVRYAPSVRARHEAHISTGAWRSRQTLRWQRQSTTYAWRLLFGRDRMR